MTDYADFLLVKGRWMGVLKCGICDVAEHHSVFGYAVGCVTHGFYVNGPSKDANCATTDVIYVWNVRNTAIASYVSRFVKKS